MGGGKEEDEEEEEKTNIVSFPDNRTFISPEKHHHCDVSQAARTRSRHLVLRSRPFILLGASTLHLTVLLKAGLCQCILLLFVAFFRGFLRKVLPGLTTWASRGIHVLWLALLFPKKFRLWISPP